MWQGRHLAHLVHVDPVSDADGVDLDVGVASRLSVLDRIPLLEGRVAVSDDDSDVLNVGSVAVLRLELSVVHDADTGGRVRVSTQIPDPSDGILQRVLVLVKPFHVLVQMEDALCVRRELDDSDAHLSRLNVQVVDDTHHKLEQQVPVVVGSITGVAVANATRTVDH